MIPTWRRAGIVMMSVPVALLWTAGVARAHVTVLPTTAVAGSETTFTFRVPTEKAAASTVKLVLALPTRTPILVVSVQPVPGWRAEVVSRDLADPVATDDGTVTKIVSRVTWSATDQSAAIAPGQFQQFTIAAGPVPRATQLVFDVLQYYSDGSVVRWIDPPVTGSELAHPAPVVTIRAEQSPTATGSAARAAPGADNGVPGWIAVAAFVAGLLGLATGSAALVVARRSRTSRSS